MTSISQPLTGLSTQCKLPISLPQAMGILQQAQGGLPVAGTPGTPPAAGAALPPKTVG
jgi:hypothetical protein